MHLLKALIVLALAGAPQAIQGPVLGFTTDATGATISPIIGVPGAAAQSDALVLDASIRSASISPKQDYAIAVRAAHVLTEEQQIVIIDLTSGTPVANPVEGAYSTIDIIAVSPSGTSAGIYNGQLKVVQVVGGLPHAATIIQQFDATGIPGFGTPLAVSDDGSIVLVQFADAGNMTLWRMGSTSAPWQIPVEQPSAAAFFPNSHNAIVADAATQSAFLIMDASGSGLQVPLISGNATGFSSVAASKDSQRVFLGDATSGTITTVDVNSRIQTQISCGCTPTGFYPLKGTSIFRLTQASGEPVAVLDASSTTPRIFVIPPHPPVRKSISVRP